VTKTKLNRECPWFASTGMQDDLPAVPLVERWNGQRWSLDRVAPVAAFTI
jgi:hypothetical protein